MSLSTRILSAVGLLGFVLAGVLGADFVPAWRQAGQAQLHQALNKASADLIEAAGALAIERGATNGMLAAPSSMTAATQASITASRTKATDALARGMASGSADAQLTDALAHLNILRDAIAQGGSGLPAPAPLTPAFPTSVSTTPVSTTPAAWFAGATAAIDAVVAQRRRIDAAAGMEPLPTTLIALRDHLAEMSEFAGRLRGSVNGLISRGGHASGAEAQAIGVLKGRIDSAWTSIEARLDRYPAAIRQDVRSAGHAWFDDFGPMRQSVMQAAAQGQDWPVTPAEWFRNATAAIDVLLQAQAHSGIAVDEALQAERTQGDNAVLVAGLCLATAVTVVLAIVWFVRRRVVAPLRQVIGVINRLAADDLDVEPPAVTSSDEIGQLCKATVRFRDTARTAKFLTGQQTAMAETALRARTDAIREIGTMIEDVSEQAIAAVKESTQRVVVVSDQVHATTAVIFADAHSAAGESSRVRESCQDAAHGARELEAAIGEIAMQMGRAAMTTRSAVAKAEAARGTFDALAVNVGEIGEVAALISQIARQTNMLALNATIEAARAGEAGKGFAVVAGEVKALAQQTARSSEHISQRIGAIEPVTREALAAMDALRHSVSDIDMIATAVAAAVEQQSAGVAAVARGVAASNTAAGEVNQKMDAVAAETGRCEHAAAEMAEIARRIETAIAGLRGTLVHLMRTRIVELDRRSETRFLVSVPGELQYDGVTHAGVILDISGGGVRFKSQRPGVFRTGATAVLSGQGLPVSPVKVTSQQAEVVHLAIAAQTEAERSAFAAAIDRLAGRAKVAA